ncbi:MAG: riboflavin synthase [Acidimicrobiia bacterium]
MFTGIIEAIGSVQSVANRDGGRTFEIATHLAVELTLGASIAVNGVCLTAVTERTTTLRVDAVAETLRRTNLSELGPGDQVNLERPLRADGRLDGHIVQGHVDTVGVVSGKDAEGDGVRLSVDVAPAYHKYIVEKGSIAVDGVSLTVAALRPAGFETALIPHTLTATNLGLRASGNTVNLEFDVLAKYLERLLGP